MRSIPYAALLSSSLLAVPLLCLATGPAGATAPQPLPEGRGKAILQQSCAGCHSLAVVVSKRATATEWNSVVQQMVARGAAGSDADIATLTRYLATNLGPGAPQFAVPALPRVQPVAVDDADDDQELPPPAPSAVQVNVNRAKARALESALSLTREEAQTLIAYREQHGDFRNWQEVGEIPGVPAGKIIAYRNRIAF